MAQYLKQHNAITEARYDMSAIEKDMFYLLLNEIKEDDEPDKEYIIDINQSNVLKDLEVEELRKAARNLLSRAYYITKPNGNILAVTLMTRVAYENKRKEMRIKISQKLFPYLVDLKKDFTTQFQLDVALSLKSKYSKRLYEMLSQHKEKGIMKITIDDLKYRLSMKSSSKGGDEQYKNWSAFQLHVLDTPKKELQEHADIHFTYTVSKTGRKYTDLTFYIEKADKNTSQLSKAWNT